MKAHHIFIFCDNHDEVANEFIQMGFVEGSKRIHANQGTRNRKFYFEDFYFEILWVHSKTEITNALTAPTDLYERSNHLLNDYSAFGLGVEYSKEDDALFENALIYQPEYLPRGQSIEVLRNTKAPTLPWTFRSEGISSFSNEPINLPHQSLEKVHFGIDKQKVHNNYLELFTSQSIVFEQANNECLKLCFSHTNKKQIKQFKSIPLVIEY